MSVTLRLGPCPVAIAASAVAFPPDAIDTPTLVARLTPGLSDERRAAMLAWVDGDIGVRSRAHLAPGADPIGPAVEAARAALAGFADEVGALVLATSTASRWTTAESARVAAAIGLEAAFFDVRSGCTAGLWALVEGARLTRDTGRPILVVGVDSFSRAFAPGERTLPLAMGDGAAALVLRPAERGGIVRAVLGGRPALVELATVRAGLPPRDGEAFVLGGDPELFARAADEALIDALAALHEVDPLPADTLIVPHVSRAATARRLGERVRRPVYSEGFAAHGSLGAASLMVALHRLGSRPGPLALVSAGGGLSYGGVLWQLARA